MKLRAYALLTLTLLPLPATAAPNPKLAIDAVVGSEVISSYDVNSRSAFIVATAHLSSTPDAIAHIRPQIIRMLIDERLQMQDAEKNKIAISDQDVADTIAAIEKDRGMPSGGVFQMMAEKRIPKETFVQQIRAQLAWREIVRRKIRPFIRISDEEVKSTPVSANTATTDLKIAVLTLPVDSPKREVEVQRLGEKLAKDIRGGANFEEAARQLSVRAGGGSTDTFWVRPEQLDPAMARALAGAEAGAITNPIRTSAGFVIVKIYETRARDSETAQDTEVQLKEILLKLKPEASQKEADALLAISEEVVKHPGTCEEKTIAGVNNIPESDIEIIFRRDMVSNLPTAVRTIAMGLKVGEISTPFASSQGIRLYMLCDRKDTSSAIAATERVRTQLFQQKLELEAQKYMRNLRKETFIEIR